MAEGLWLFACVHWMIILDTSITASGFCQSVHASPSSTVSRLRQLNFTFLCFTVLEVSPCFFLSCEANVRVKPAKTGHGLHSFQFLCCPIHCLFCVVLCIVCVYMCTVLLPPSDYPIAVKYIISYSIHCIIITIYR
jgi:hypothetical protein